MKEAQFPAGERFEEGQGTGREFPFSRPPRAALQVKKYIMGVELDCTRGIAEIQETVPQQVLFLPQKTYCGNQECYSSKWTKEGTA